MSRSGPPPTIPQTIEVAAHGAVQPPFPIARIDRFSILEFPYPAAEADFACRVDLPVHSPV